MRNVEKFRTIFFSFNFYSSQRESRNFGHSISQILKHFHDFLFFLKTTRPFLDYSARCVQIFGNFSKNRFFLNKIKTQIKEKNNLKKKEEKKYKLESEIQDETRATRENSLLGAIICWELCVSESRGKLFSAWRENGRVPRSNESILSSSIISMLQRFHVG